MDVESPASHIEHAQTPIFRSSQAPLRCHQCDSRQNGRNLVVCIDGTSNEIGDHNTNVVKLFAKVDLETTRPEQLAYYTSGIGTDPKSLNVLNRVGRAVSDKLDMAIAWNIEDSIREAYSWLARDYREGDQIYFFGFSRGAYQVRVLADMIHQLGLIKRPTEKQITRAFYYYNAIQLEKPQSKQIAREFKNIFSWNHMKVHFIGVWDTVSSVGVVRGKNFLSASSCAGHACHFRHALALDELRVKFMPEYFHEVNSQTDYVFSSGKKSKVSDFKEVWFAGSHSDVGGVDRSGKPRHAGNVSLLWMRRQASACGLVLQPTDIVWVPDDIDLGISDSMTRVWQLIEYMPITHQVSFSGSGRNARRLHRLQPRRVLPGQKVHASILYANAYMPQASLGEGFEIPTIHTGLETELDSGLWETEVFDDTAAQELVAYLGDQQGDAPIHLDRLLFILRFEEGKQCVRNAANWQRQFLRLIHSPDCAPLVRLIIIVAFYEASCDPDAHLKSHALPHVELSQETFNEAKKSFSTILAVPKHPDGPRVVALLRPLTRHRVLRERILTQDVLETLMHVLDVIIGPTGGNFGQAMDGLTSLLQCEDTQWIIIQKLGTNLPNTNVSRLSRILEIKDPRLLTAALRMVLTLARIPEARPACLSVKPRLRELAQKDRQLVGLLSVEILVALYHPDERESLNVHSADVRANLAGALVRLSPDRRNSTNGEGCSVDPGQVVLCRLFGVGNSALELTHRKLIGKLKRAIEKGNAQERTSATLTVLKLCETEAVRTFLHEIGLLSILIGQLRHKKSALLAAYALAVCLEYYDMNKILMGSILLPTNIVNMLRLDYFDDAIGQIEGFQIFGGFMQHPDLREKIKEFNITHVLYTKLAKGKLRETRTSLICLDIFRSFDEDGPWTRQLVEKSLDHLRKPDWMAQKAGVIILSSLSQTGQGVAAICPRICEIVEMLLPEGYLPTKSASPNAPDFPHRPPSWMMGPACALRILGQNEKLRETTRSTLQYGSLKRLYLTGTLMNETDTPVWRINTPNREDVDHAINKVIKVVDEELSEEGLMSIGDAVLPHIKHWDRLGGIVGSKIVSAIAILPALLGVSALAILATAAAPVYLSVRAVGLVKELVGDYQDSQILEQLRDSSCVAGEDSRGGDDDASGSHSNIKRSQQDERLPNLMERLKRQSMRQADD